jgi:hypothetical protein
MAGSGESDDVKADSNFWKRRLNSTAPIYSWVFLDAFKWYKPNYNSINISFVVNASCWIYRTKAQLFPSLLHPQIQPDTILLTSNHLSRGS